MLLVIFHMNGHIQDFAHKLKPNTNKEKNKMNTEAAAQKSSGIIQAAAKDFKPNSSATIAFSLGKTACNDREKGLAFLPFPLERRRT